MKTIFWGLDHTLIDADPFTDKSDFARTIIHVSKSEAYAVARREPLIALVASMRERTENRLLTNSPRTYARHMNVLCELGFAEHEIWAREDFLCTVNTPYGPSDSLIPKEVGQFPQSLWIDDLPIEGRTREISEAKRLFLGDPLMFKVRSFHGQDPESFKEELQALEDWLFCNF